MSREHVQALYLSLQTYLADRSEENRSAFNQLWEPTKAQIDSSCVNSGFDASHDRLLHLAVRLGDAAVVQHLLERGATLTAFNHEQETPLHVVAREGSAAVARVMIEHALDVAPGAISPLNLLNGEQETVFDIVVAREGADDVQAVFGRVPFDRKGIQAFIRRIHQSDALHAVDVMRFSVTNSSLFMINLQGQTLLHAVLRHIDNPHMPDAVKTLLDAGANPEGISAASAESYLDRLLAVRPLSKNACLAAGHLIDKDAFFKAKHLIAVAEDKSKEANHLFEKMYGKVTLSDEERGECVRVGNRHVAIYIALHKKQGVGDQLSPGMQLWRKIQNEKSPEELVGYLLSLDTKGRFDVMPAVLAVLSALESAETDDLPTDEIQGIFDALSGEEQTGWRTAFAEIGLVFAAELGDLDALEKAKSYWLKWGDHSDEEFLAHLLSCPKGHESPVSFLSLLMAKGKAQSYCQAFVAQWRSKEFDLEYLKQLEAAGLDLLSLYSVDGEETTLYEMTVGKDGVRRYLSRLATQKFKEQCQQKDWSSMNLDLYERLGVDIFQEVEGKTLFAMADQATALKVQQKATAELEKLAITEANIARVKCLLRSGADPFMRDGELTLYEAVQQLPSDHGDLLKQISKRVIASPIALAEAQQGHVDLLRRAGVPEQGKVGGKYLLIWGLEKKDQSALQAEFERLVQTDPLTDEVKEAITFCVDKKVDLLKLVDQTGKTAFQLLKERENSGDDDHQKRVKLLLDTIVKEVTALLQAQKKFSALSLSVFEKSINAGADICALYGNRTLYAWVSDRVTAKEAAQEKERATIKKFEAQLEQMRKPKEKESEKGKGKQKKKADEAEVGKKKQEEIDALNGELTLIPAQIETTQANEKQLPRAVVDAEVAYLKAKKAYLEEKKKGLEPSKVPAQQMTADARLKLAKSELATAEAKWELAKRKATVKNPREDELVKLWKSKVEKLRGGRPVEKVDAAIKFALAEDKVQARRAKLNQCRAAQTRLTEAENAKHRLLDTKTRLSPEERSALDAKASLSAQDERRLKAQAETTPYWQWQHECAQKELALAKAELDLLSASEAERESCQTAVDAAKKALSEAESTKRSTQLSYEIRACGTRIQKLGRELDPLLSFQEELIRRANKRLEDAINKNSPKDVESALHAGADVTVEVGEQTFYERLLNKLDERGISVEQCAETIRMLKALSEKATLLAERAWRDGDSDTFSKILRCGANFAKNYGQAFAALLKEREELERQKKSTEKPVQPSSSGLLGSWRLFAGKGSRPTTPASTTSVPDSRSSTPVSRSSTPRPATPASDTASVSSGGSSVPEQLAVIKAKEETLRAGLQRELLFAAKCGDADRFETLLSHLSDSDLMFLVTDIDRVTIFNAAIGAHQLAKERVQEEADDVAGYKVTLFRRVVDICVAKLERLAQTKLDKMEQAEQAEQAEKARQVRRFMTAMPVKFADWRPEDHRQLFRLLIDENTELDQLWALMEKGVANAVYRVWTMSDPFERTEASFVWGSFFLDYAPLLKKTGVWHEAFLDCTKRIADEAEVAAKQAAEEETQANAAVNVAKKAAEEAAKQAQDAAGPVKQAVEGAAKQAADAVGEAEKAAKKAAKKAKKRKLEAAQSADRYRRATQVVHDSVDNAIQTEAQSGELDYVKEMMRILGEEGVLLTESSFSNFSLIKRAGDIWRGRQAAYLALAKESRTHGVVMTQEQQEKVKKAQGLRERSQVVYDWFAELLQKKLNELPGEAGKAAAEGATKAAAEGGTKASAKEIAKASAEASAKAAFVVVKQFFEAHKLWDWFDFDKHYDWVRKVGQLPIVKDYLLKAGAEHLHTAIAEGKVDKVAICLKLAGNELLGQKPEGDDAVFPVIFARAKLTEMRKSQGQAKTTEIAAYSRMVGQLESCLQDALCNTLESGATREKWSLLLEAGADFLAKDQRGRTPVSVAMKKADSGAREFLQYVQQTFSQRRELSAEERACYEQVIAFNAAPPKEKVKRDKGKGKDEGKGRARFGDAARKVAKGDAQKTGGGGLTLAQLLAGLPRSATATTGGASRASTGGGVGREGSRAVTQVAKPAGSGKPRSQRQATQASNGGGGATPVATKPTKPARGGGLTLAQLLAGLLVPAERKPTQPEHKKAPEVLQSWTMPASKTTAADQAAWLFEQLNAAIEGGGAAARAVIVLPSSLEEAKDPAGVVDVLRLPEKLELRLDLQRLIRERKAGGKIDIIYFPMRAMTPSGDGVNHANEFVDAYKELPKALQNGAHVFALQTAEDEFDFEFQCSELGYDAQAVCAAVRNILRAHTQRNWSVLAKQAPQGGDGEFVTERPLTPPEPPRTMRATEVEVSAYQPNRLGKLSFPNSSYQDENQGSRARAVLNELTDELEEGGVRRVVYLVVPSTLSEANHIFSGRKISKDALSRYLMAPSRTVHGSPELLQPDDLGYKNLSHKFVYQLLHRMQALADDQLANIRILGVPVAKWSEHPEEVPQAALPSRDEVRAKLGMVSKYVHDQGARVFVMMEGQEGDAARFVTRPGPELHVDELNDRDVALQQFLGHLADGTPLPADHMFEGVEQSGAARPALAGNPAALHGAGRRQRRAPIYNGPMDQNALAQLVAAIVAPAEAADQTFRAPDLAHVTPEAVLGSGVVPQ